MDRRAWWATYSPWSLKESDMMEQLTHTKSIHYSDFLGFCPMLFFLLLLFRDPTQVTILPLFVIFS